MKLISINIGVPREVEWNGKIIPTSIFKAPVTGPVRVNKLSLEGDTQSDPRFHGGLSKAVYIYPSEHYTYWHTQFPETALPWGAFGENLTTEGLDEHTIRIGDRLEIGTARFQVTRPRTPCFKLGIRFGRQDIVNRFQDSGRCGFYLAVMQEGKISPGDTVQLYSDDQNNLTVSEINRLYTTSNADPEMLRRASQLEALSEDWRELFRNRLAPK